GKTHIEELKGQKIIVIDEIPYQVNKSTLCSKIGELVMEKKIEGIVDMRDESSKNIIRVTITLRKGIDPNDVLTQLYKFTELQTNFNINNVSLIEKASQPRVMNIKELLMEFVTFRREVIYKRSVFQLNKAKDRLHILEGLKKAIDILDDVIATIRNANTKQEAKEALMNNFEFSDEQAEYILQMRLQSLVGLEFQKVLDEIEEKKKQIEYLEGIINNPKKLDEVVIDEMVYVKDEYGDARRTEVSTDTSVYELTGSIKALRKAQDQIKEDVILWIGNDHTVRVLYQSRINIIPEDSLEVVYTHNQDKLIALTDTGELVIERLKDLGSFQMKQKSLDIKEKYGLKGNIIFVSSMLHDYQYLGFLSNDNSIKKIKKELLLSFRKFPTVCMSLKEGEKLIKVEAVREGDKIGVVSEQGLLTLFPESGIRPMGKTAGGVKAIELPADDKVANFFVYKDEPFIMIYGTKAGKLINKEDLIFGKSEYANRGGKTLLVSDIEGKETIKG
ncbi:MAG TPA: DNA gyrase subunit A, partial [Candidatus Absconditabacterales bacterium]|nr:DNA gyrase subunit A [Candidatus Absconditabacterales bacterium]